MGELEETYDAQDNASTAVADVAMSSLQSNLHAQWVQCQSKVIKQILIIQVGIQMQNLTK